MPGHATADVGAGVRLGAAINDLLEASAPSLPPRPLLPVLPPLPPPADGAGDESAPKLPAGSASRSKGSCSLDQQAVQVDLECPPEKREDGPLRGEVQVNPSTDAVDPPEAGGHPLGCEGGGHDGLIVERSKFSKMPPHSTPHLLDDGPVTDLSKLECHGRMKHLLLTVHYPEASVKHHLEDLQIMREGLQPYLNEGIPTETRIVEFPPQLKSVLCLPMQLDASLCPAEWTLIEGGVSNGLMARGYILWPSSVKTPGWLRDQFVQWSGRCCVVQWEQPGRWHRLQLMLAGKEQEYGTQVLTIWHSKSIYKSGDKIKLRGPDCNREVLDVPYVVGFRFAFSTAVLAPDWRPPNLGAAVSRAIAGEDEGKSPVQILCELATKAEYATVLQLGEDGKSEHGVCRAVQLAIAQSTTDMLRGLLAYKTTDMVRSHLIQDELCRKKIICLAIEREEPDLIMILFTLTNSEMSLKALQYLVHSLAQERLAGSGYRTAMANANTMESFLLQHVCGMCNPLSVTASILMAIKEEMNAFDETDKVLSKIAMRVQSLHISILDQLGLRVAESGTRTTTLHQMASVLQPSGGKETRSANWVSPLMIAYILRDTEFICHPALVAYFKSHWKGWEFSSCSKDMDSLSAANSNMGARLMINMGLAGTSFDPLLNVSMRTMHAYAFNSTAFFNSPRGRWAMHALCETAFLAIFQVCSTNPRHVVGWDIALLIFTSGNMLSVLQFLHLQYGSVSRMGVMLRDPWDALNIITNITLIVLLVLNIMRLYSIDAKRIPEYEPGDPIHMAFSASAILVWSRTLSVVVPVYPKLGPLLNTVWNMAAEILAFLFPFSLVLAGFATLFTGVYSELVSDYSSFVTACLTLFSSVLGNFNYTDFQTDEDGNPVPLDLEIYGCIFLTIYLLLSSIMLLNLLIAIITSRYNPSASLQDTQYKQSQIVTQYSVQVQHCLVCSPFNIAHIALWLLPSYERPRARFRGWMKWLLIFVSPDGLASAPDTTGNIHLHRSGRGDFPYLCFLLTLYPIMATISAVTYLLFLPFAIWKFTMNNGWRTFFKREMRPSQVAPDETMISKHPKEGDRTWTQSSQTSFYLGQVMLDMADGISYKGSTKAMIINLLLILLMLTFSFAAGVVMYLIIGVIGFFLIMTLWWWIVKVAFSLNNVFILPWFQLVRKLLSKAEILKGRSVQDKESSANTTVTDREVSSHSMSGKQHWKKVADSLPFIAKMNREPYLSKLEMDRALKASMYEPFLEPWGISVKQDYKPAAGQAGTSDGAQTVGGDHVCPDYDDDYIEEPVVETREAALDRKLAEQTALIMQLHQSVAALQRKMDTLSDGKAGKG